MGTRVAFGVGLLVGIVLGAIGFYVAMLYISVPQGSPLFG